ncbi:endonuclease-reverse transcriptase domain-containing protein [Hirsutella rhossiliensis]|uniref:Endonuclease-reverse transcriptase domain-containing protein n=1 Tax=Hirsutella rhossiliensis TaxID=111463 RepID=A0A9P8MQ96_9HYPO|nr:endonuclease-reverse transcriptase domain-containing protein [Hirsutella rhossiliensis]KAH0957252.1 endonuclease-reverse transcriptase domain-containing protein [Hirsutella rhossiliensis]
MAGGSAGQVAVGLGSPSASPTRSTRGVTPSGRVQDTLRSLENATSKTSKRPATRATRISPAETEIERVIEEKKARSNGETGKAMLQRVLEVLGRMGGEMGRLKDAIHEQSDTIRAQESLIRELQSQVKESRRESDRENKELREELQNTKKDLRQIREQLEAFNAATNSERNSPQASYADVARITPSNISTNLSSPSTRMTPSSFSDTLYCTIDLSRVEDQNRGRAQVGEIRQAVEAEMRAKEGHEGWRCAAVVKDARNAERVKIMCRNETELQRVKDAAQKTAVIGARVMRDQLYPVKVDNANRTAVLDAEGYVLTGAAEALGVENNVTIAKISWLSNKEIGKANRSQGLLMECIAAEPKKLGIFQLNVRKRDTVQLSVMNDEELKDCAVLAIAEPYARKKDGMIVTAPMGHSSWSRILPTQTNEAGWPVRSMLWIRKDIDSEQVPIPSSDLTAAVLHLPDRDVLVMSVYVQGKDEEALILTTTELGGLITRFRNGTGKRTDVVLAGDFNRHDLLWGGDCVTSRRQGEGQPIIDLMNEHGLCSLLPRGTKTWQGPDKESTIDLMLVSTELADDMVKCAIHPAEYGSDHRAIHTAFDIDLPERDLTPRLLLRNAPWTAIRNRTDRFMEVHWDDFLADDGNIWRAAKYLKEQAEELLSAFFPPLPDAIEPEHEGPQRAPVPMPELTMEEIERKVMTAKPWKAPGDDGLPAMQWRMAKIIPLKKPGKDDYTAARAWRPISLLSTLGKILEAVMAERISFAVETFGLLPTNHFGARKRRSAEQALVLLQEKIYKAWRMGKASTTARSEGFARELVFPGIAAFADSLSFFNADLVQTKISTSGGSIAFVDDYSAWVTGSTAESNRDGIQSIIDRALEWEKRSGATFEGDKTTIIHFTRMAERSSSSPFVIKGRTIWPQENAKVLGVVMDAKLRYKEHMLFTAAVAPAMDYASTAVTGAFRTVSTAVAEAEASIRPVRKALSSRRAHPKGEA